MISKYKIENSALYSCEVYHARSEKLKRSFKYRTFMFYIDLDEISAISKKIWLVSHNRFNYFNFRDKDHLQLKPGKAESVRSQIESFLKQNNIIQKPRKICLLTNLCTLGYQFNPVSFYYCFDENEIAFAVIAEVNNTFGEMKLFLLSSKSMEGNVFTARKKKYFYVSPFIDHDVDFDFHLSVPDKELYNRIDDYKDDKRIFTASLKGKKSKLSNVNVTMFILRFPLMTLMVIFLIHYQALLLLLKGIPYFKKNENIHLQQNRLKKYEERNKKHQSYGKDINTTAQEQF
jgi:DUF1365 family protein